jgi:hypothetical protein
MTNGMEAEEPRQPLKQDIMAEAGSEVDHVDWLIG